MPYLQTHPKIQQDGDFEIGGKSYTLKETPGRINEAQRQAALYWDKCYKRFYMSKASRLTPAALRQVEWALVPHLRQMIEQGVGPHDYTPEHLEIRNAERLAQRISNTTIRQDHMMLSAMFAICKKAKLVKDNPAAEVKMPPKIVAYVPTPSRLGLVDLLRTVHNLHRPSTNPGCRVLGRAKNVWVYQRDTAIIVLAARTAMRPGEIFRLLLSDYNATEGYIDIRVAKDRHPRRIPIFADVIDAIETWLKQRPNDVDCKYLFLSDRHLPMRVNSWSKEFRRYAVAAGMDGITPRSLRHRGITDTAVEGGLLAAARNAGHSLTAGTTAKYLKDGYAETKKSLAAVAHLDTSGIGDGRSTKRRI